VRTPQHPSCHLIGLNVGRTSSTCSHAGSYGAPQANQYGYAVPSHMRYWQLKEFSPTCSPGILRLFQQARGSVRNPGTSQMKTDSENDSSNYCPVPEAVNNLRDYFTFYNQERLHQALGCQTPAQVYTGTQHMRGQPEIAGREADVKNSVVDRPYKGAHAWDT